MGWQVARAIGNLRSASDSETLRYVLTTGTPNDRYRHQTCGFRPYLICEATWEVPDRFQMLIMIGKALNERDREYP